MLRARLSYVMYWRGRFADSRDLAADGLRYVSQGLVGANLHLKQARARPGSASLTRPARRSGSRTPPGRTGTATTWPRSAARSSPCRRPPPTPWPAARSPRPATGTRRPGNWNAPSSLYDEGPRPGEQHGFGGKALAGTDLAVVRLRSGALDAGAAALEPVLALPRRQRLATLTARLAYVRGELAAPVFRGSPQARDLGDQIEEFGRAAITTGLHSLSG